MTPEQFHELREDIRDTIQEKVNGKVDRLEKKLDAHIEKVEPILDALSASRFFAKTVSLLGGVLIGFGAIYSVFKGILRLP